MSNRDYLREQKKKHKDKFQKYPFANKEIEEEIIQGPIDVPEPDLPQDLKPLIKKKGLGGVSVFGSDMDLMTKRKLETRQYLNSENRSGPNKSITTIYSHVDGKPDTYSINDPALGINLQFDGQAEMSGRTPMVRMWTSLQLQTSTEVASWHKNQDDDHTRYPDKYSYTVRGNRVIEEETTNHDRKIYVVGNHILTNLEGKPNEPRTGDVLENNLGGLLLPDMSRTIGTPGYEENQFLSPPAGITEVSSQTEGNLGLIKTTTINFTVNNFHDFENIFQRYFLRPGAQIFVDFGWSSSELYDPKLLCYDEYKKGRELDELLYGTDGIITSKNGDLEVIQGFVTDFKSNLTTEGVYECSLDLISKNNSLLEASFTGGNEGEKRQLLATLDAAILNFAAKHFGADMLGQNKIYDYTQAEMQNEMLYTFGAEALKSTSTKGKNVKIPASKEVLITGVYWQTHYAKDPEDEDNPDELKEVPGDSKSIYIMYGLFEDIILNKQFGFGKDDEDVLYGNDVAIRFDSSNSYVTWEKTLEKSSHVDKAEPYVFRYPETWDKTYNTFRNKTHIDKINSAGKYIEKPDDDNHQTWTSLDKSKRRIPLREIFVNLGTIKEAIEKKTNVKQILEYVLKELRTASEDIWDLQLGSGRKDGSQVSVQDRNFVQAERDSDGQPYYLEKMFVFKPQSPDSIVKDMSLDFGMPSGDMQNMIAIGSGGAGTSVFAMDKRIDKTLAMSVFNEIGNGLNVQYLPTMGTFPMEKLQKKLSEGFIVDSLYNPDDEIFAGDDETSAAILDNFGSAQPTSHYLKKTQERLGPEKWKEMEMLNMSDDQVALLNTTTNILSYAKWVVPHGTILWGANKLLGGEVTDEDVQKREEQKKKLEVKESDFLNDTDQLAPTIQKYYKLLAKSSFFFLNTSTLIPIELTITIDGISSLNVGNIFKVDYLPKMYRDQTYFQITGIKHSLGSQGWSTELTSLMRISPMMKKQSDLFAESTNVYLSKKALTDGRDCNVVNKHIFEEPGDSSNLFPFISKMQLLGTGEDFKLGYTDYIFSFEAATDFVVNKGNFANQATTSNDMSVRWGVAMGLIHWGFPWGAKPKRPYKWQHSVDGYCGRYPNFFMMGLQDAKTSKAGGAPGGWDYYYNYWSCNLKIGLKYILQLSKSGNAVIYPYPEKNDGSMNKKDFQMLQWHIDGWFHMYAGLITKNRNYRPPADIWSRMKQAQAYMDKKTTGWYEGGRKPNWINKTAYFLRSNADTKYRFQDD